MTLSAFLPVITTLAVATSKQLDDETIDTYFSHLKDVPIETLQEATGTLIKSAKFFPSVGEIRTSCDRVHDSSFQSFSVPAVAPGGLLENTDPRLWYACVTCQDSGWASYWCRGSVDASPRHPSQYLGERSCGSAACARLGPKGYGHEFMVRCACFPTNPTIVKRLAARKSYADKS
jgi:hypothetical protein